MRPASTAKQAEVIALPRAFHLLFLHYCSNHILFAFNVSTRWLEPSRCDRSISAPWSTHCTDSLLSECLSARTTPWRMESGWDSGWGWGWVVVVAGTLVGAGAVAGTMVGAASVLGTEAWVGAGAVVVVGANPWRVACRLALLQS